MPELFIITGSNGAGKSSVGATYLPEEIRENFPVFDGDKLYMSKQKELWAGGIRVIKEAKKLALAFVNETFDSLIENALYKKETFVYEGHFINETTWDIPKKFKAQGYKINMVFLGLENPDISETRVIKRVIQGGHFVPRVMVESNFYGNLEKLNKHYALIDNLEIIDTSETNHVKLASFTNGLPVSSIPINSLPKWFIMHLPALTTLIMRSNLTM